MSNIEEDIKILEKFNPGDEYTEKVKQAIEHILAEREADKKKIDKLQVLEDDLKDKRIVYVDTPEFEEKFIPKQKVKEIIENETINISGFECIALEDLENLLEE